MPERKRFEQAWSSREWHTEHFSDKERAWGWWQAALADSPSFEGAVNHGRITVNALCTALEGADQAINPPNREGISLDKWDGLLRRATNSIRDALEHGRFYLKNTEQFVSK